MTSGAGSVYSVGTQDKGMLHAMGRTERDLTRFRHVTQNGEQFKTYELFLPGIFHLICSDCGWLQVSETAESETVESETAD